MELAEVQVLLREFAAPLSDYASSSPDRKELAEMLVRNLWTAMIAGPEMEEETWKIIKDQANLDAATLQPLQDVYHNEMKAVVSEEQLAALRQRYQFQRKGG